MNVLVVVCARAGDSTSRRMKRAVPRAPVGSGRPFLTSAATGADVQCEVRRRPQNEATLSAHGRWSTIGAPAAVRDMRCAAPRLTLCGFLTTLLIGCAPGSSTTGQGSGGSSGRGAAATPLRPEEHRDRRRDWQRRRAVSGWRDRQRRCDECRRLWRNRDRRRDRDGRHSERWRGQRRLAESARTAARPAPAARVVARERPARVEPRHQGGRSARAAARPREGRSAPAGARRREAARARARPDLATSTRPPIRPAGRPTARFARSTRRTPAPSTRCSARRTRPPRTSWSAPEASPTPPSRTRSAPGTTCTIPIIYDQSPNGNHLRVTWLAYWLQSGGNPANGHRRQDHGGGAHRLRHQVRLRTLPIEPACSCRGRPRSPRARRPSPSRARRRSPRTRRSCLSRTRKDCPANSWPNNCNFQAYFTAAAINASTTVTLTASYAGTSSSATVVWNARHQGDRNRRPGGGRCMRCSTARRTASAAASTTGTRSWTASTTAMPRWRPSTGAPTPSSGSPAAAAAHGSRRTWRTACTKAMKTARRRSPSNTSVTGFPYVTAMLKGLSAKDCPAGLTSSGCFALKAGNARPASSSGSATPTPELRRAPARLQSPEEARRHHPGHRRRWFQHRHRNLVRRSHDDGRSVGCDRRRRAGQHRGRGVRALIFVTRPGGPQQDRAPCRCRRLLLSDRGPTTRSWSRGSPRAI